MKIDELLGRRVSMRAMALLRVLIGPIVLLHLRPFLLDAWHGRIYRDTFHEPYASWYPELPRPVYVGVLCVGALAAVAMTLGVRTRLSTAIVLAVVAYNVFLSTTHLHNNRAYLLIVLAALAVTPCGRELSLDAWWRRRRGLPPAADDVAGMAAVAAALRGGHGLRRVRAEQARRPGLVRWRGHVAPRRADASAHRGVGAARLGRARARRPLVPHRRGQADRRHRAVHRRSGCGRAGPAMPRCGSPSASMSPSNSQLVSRCSPTWRSPRS